MPKGGLVFDQEKNTLSRKLENVVSELQTRQQQNEVLMTDIRQVEAKLTDLKEQSAKVKQERLCFEYKYDVVRQDSLWRLSKPIRQGLDLLKRMRRNLFGPRR